MGAFYGEGEAKWDEDLFELINARAFISRLYLSRAPFDSRACSTRGKSIGRRNTCRANKCALSRRPRILDLLCSVVASFPEIKVDFFFTIRRFATGGGGEKICATIKRDSSRR